MATIVPATIKFSEFAEQTAAQDDIFVGLKSGANAQFTYAAAPSDATYILQTADSDLTNAQAIGDLASGLLVGTTTTGVILSRTLTGTSNEIDVANGDGISGNPTVGISDNPVIPGTAGMSIPAGTTGERVVPTTPNINLRWNTTINAIEYYDHGSTAWEQLAESLPDGPDTSVQYNNGGAFAGSANFTFDGSQVAITGDLQVDNININGNTITSTDAAGNINLTPDTTGDLVLDGVNWPQADGSAGQVLTTNGAAQLSWSSAGSVTVPTVDQTVARFNGTAGALEDSGVTIDDSDVMSGVTQLNVDNLRADGNTIDSTSGALNLTGATDVNITSTSGDINLTAGSGNIVAADNFIAGDPGTESSGININGTTFDSVCKVSDIGGSNAALGIYHRHSTTLQPLLIGAHSNSDTSAHGTVTSGQSMFTVYGAGWTGSHYDLFGAIDISADTSGTISTTSSPGRIRFQVTPDASNTPVTALTISNNSNVTFANNAIFATAKGILDGNSNEQLLFTQTASAVNYVNITNAATSGNPVLEATGSDSNVSLKLNGKGTGAVLMGSAATAKPFSSLLGGDAVIVSDNASNPLIVKTNSSGASQSAAVFHQSSASPTFDGFRVQTVGTSSTQSIANFLSGTNDATGSGTSRMFIRQDGNVGIGTTSPSSTLEVVGDAQVDNINIDGNTISSTSGDLALTPNGANDLILDGLNWPQADGTQNQALVTDGSAQLSWATVSLVTTPTVDNTIARFNGVAGALQDSGITVNDSDVISGVTQLNVDNVRIDGNTISSINVNGDLNLTPNGTGDLVLDGVNWPQADGTNGQVLQTNGSGQTSWVAPSATSGLQSVQIFTSSGTWTKPAGINKVNVVVVGGGGGGGGCSATAVGQASNSAGGGGGGCAIEFIDVTGTASETVTIGAGGGGGSAGNNAGSNGGTSSFGSFCSATGGNGASGSGATFGDDVVTAPQGGVGSGGDLNFRGDRGMNGRVLGGKATYMGAGGGTYLAGMNFQSGTSSTAGAAYGAGGTGAISNALSAAKAGGDGADGVVIVYEYA